MIWYVLSQHPKQLWGAAPFRHVVTSQSWPVPAMSIIQAAVHSLCWWSSMVDLKKWSFGASRDATGGFSPLLAVNVIRWPTFTFPPHILYCILRLLAVSDHQWKMCQALLIMIISIVDRTQFAWDCCWKPPPALIILILPPRNTRPDPWRLLGGQWSPHGQSLVKACLMIKLLHYTWYKVYCCCYD